jgi:sulfhydrogenase subunit beta (sulfur reductase)
MLVITSKDIQTLANQLAIKNQVIAPVKRSDDETNFQKLEKDEKINLNYSTTILPIKQYLLHPKEETFSYSLKNKKATYNQTIDKYIILGLNLKDLEALLQLDEIMKKPKEDYYYFSKRKATTVIAVISEQGEIPAIGFDLILEKLNAKEYKAIPITAKGKTITKSKLFKNRRIKNQSKRRKTKTMPDLRNLLLDAELLHDAVKWSWENKPKVWEKLSKQCISCGICTYVCPLCYCFSIEDRCHLNGKECTKSRYWTACTLPEFSKITRGHTFHRTIKERYYNWFYHKFVRAYHEYGKSQCVACGRCQEYCPAKIDIEKILMQIVTSYKKKYKL